MSPKERARQWWLVWGRDIRGAVVGAIVTVVLGVGGWGVSLDRTMTAHGVRLEGMTGIEAQVEALGHKLEAARREISGEFTQYSERFEVLGERLARMEGILATLERRGGT